MNRILGVSYGVMALAMASPAFAQSTESAPAVPQANVPAPASQIQDSTLGDIVVTAQKRAQRLADVPVAVTAVDGTALQQRAITQFSQLTQVSPSLTLTVGSNPANNSVVLRGVGTFSFSTGAEPSVAILVDDLPVLNTAQAFSGLSDVERVEVLRGPQGTLFGKASSAGVISIVSRAPSFTWKGSADAGVTTDGQYTVNGSVSGPLSDNIAFRLSGSWQNFDGFVRNLTTGNDLGGTRSRAVHGSVTANVTSNLTVDLSARYSYDKEAPFQSFRVVAPGSAIIGTQVSGSLTGITPGPENDKVRNTLDQSATSKTTAIRGAASLDLGFASLTSITGYQKWVYSPLVDIDNMDIPVLGSPLGVYNYGDYTTKLWTEEMRLASKGGGPFQYLVGLYFADGDSTRDFTRFPFGSTQGADWSARNGTTTYAAFAQGTYNITPSTHFDAGVRFNREKITVDFKDTVLPTPAPASNCLTTCSGKNDQNKVTYKFALRQDLTRGVMAYASYGTGFKGQAFDISSGFNPGRATNPVAAEESKAYEAGLKGQFLGNRAQLNLAVFRTDYDNFQAQSAVTLPSGASTFVLANVGKLRTQGVEVEASARPVRALTLSATAAYVDAKILSYPRAQCYPGQTAALGCVGGLQDRSGYRPPNAPKFKYTISGRYDAPLDTTMNGFLQADWRHQSAVSYDILGNPVSQQGSYGVFDLSVGVHTADNRFTVAFYTKNLFDKAYASTVLAPAGAAGVVSVQTFARDYRRYFGARVSYNF